MLPNSVCVEGLKHYVEHCTRDPYLPFHPPPKGWLPWGWPAPIAAGGLFGNRAPVN